MTQQFSQTLDMVTHFQQLADHDKALLARELHDALGGLLIGAVMDLDGVSPRFAAMEGPAQQKIARVRLALDAAIELTRRITEELHPTLLDNVGLFAALRWQLRNACAKPQVKCIEDFPDQEPELRPEDSIALFRIGQEALVVGLERPGVTQLRLAASSAGARVSLELAGDGSALPEDPGALANLHLESLRHRVRGLDGSLRVESAPAGGILLAVTVPRAPLGAPP